MPENISTPQQLHDRILAFLQSLGGEKLYNVSITINCDARFFDLGQPVRSFPVSGKEVSYQDFTLPEATVRNHVTIIKSEPPPDWEG